MAVSSVARFLQLHVSALCVLARSLQLRVHVAAVKVVKAAAKGVGKVMAKADLRCTVLASFHAPEIAYALYCPS